MNFIYSFLFYEKMQGKNKLKVIVFDDGFKYYPAMNTQIYEEGKYAGKTQLQT